MACAELTRRLRIAQVAHARVPSVRAYGRPPSPSEGDSQGEAALYRSSVSGGTDMSYPPSPSGEPADTRRDFRSESQPSRAQVRNAEELDGLDAEGDFDIGIPWSEDEIHVVFNKFSHGDDKEVNVEDMLHLVRYLGVRALESEVREIIEGLTRFSSLSYQECCEFLRRWRKLDVRHLEGEFMAADIDGNGTLDIKELHTLLLQSGYSPTADVTLEALHEIDDDGDEKLDFGEFEHLREYLRKTRGFLKAETAELQMIFRRVAGAEENMLMPVDELWRIRNFLGFCCTREELSTIIASIDMSGSGRITYDEMLQVVRALQDIEFEDIRRVLDRYTSTEEQVVDKIYDSRRRSQEKVEKQRTTSFGRAMEAQDSEQRDGAEQELVAHVRTLQSLRRNFSMLRPKIIWLSHLDGALHDLGYLVSSEMLQEILDTKLANRQEPHSVTAAELSDFLRAWRLAEGFTRQETKELLEIFECEQGVSVAGSDDTALDALELGRVLRRYGISKTLQQVRRLIEEVDFDGSQQLGVTEFLKLMRELLQEEAKQRRSVFDLFRHRKTGMVLVEKLPAAVHAIMGVAADCDTIEAVFQDSAIEVSSSKGSAAMTWPEFEVFFRKYRRVLMESVQRNAGFVLSEVTRLRGIFQKYDANDSGKLDDVELRALIHDLMPEAMLSYEGNREMQRVLSNLPPSADAPVTATRSRRPSDTTARVPSSLDFFQFLTLMRRYYDLRDEKDITREADSVLECGLPAEEVEAFREIFLLHVDSSGEMDMSTLLAMITKLTEVKEKHEIELEALVKELSPEKRPVSRFPQFLRLMKRVMDGNWLGISEKAEQIVFEREREDSHRASVY